MHRVLGQASLLTVGLCQRLGVWAFACQRWLVCRGVCECVCRRSTLSIVQQRAWRHLTLNNRCGGSEYLMGGG